MNYQSDLNTWDLKLSFNTWTNSHDSKKQTMTLSSPPGSDFLNSCEKKFFGATLKCWTMEDFLSLLLISDKHWLTIFSLQNFTELKWNQLLSGGKFFWTLTEDSEYFCLICVFVQMDQPASCYCFLFLVSSDLCSVTQKQFLLTQ